MSDVFSRLKRILTSERIGKLVFATAVAVTAAAVAIPRGSSAVPPGPGINPGIIAGTPGDVQVSATLSQTKLVQGSDGTFYLQVAVESPAGKTAQSARTPVDLVVVLDKSGSMAADNRMPYAKTAMKELLSRLNPEDRFGLITFDTATQILTPLGAVTPEFRRVQSAVIDEIAIGGSTNLSGGLELAKTVFGPGSSGRTRKVVLMSDGEANVGITDPKQLAQIARTFSQQETIVSTVGMGLGFNEVLMASLADNGMGNYSYLENLASLGEILQKDLQDTRTVYASSSGLEIKLPPSFRLVDSAGYPQETGTIPGTVRLLTGQLLGGAKKTFFLSFAAPTGSVGSIPLGEMNFHYTAGGMPHSVKIDGTKLALSIVEPARAEEAFASANEEVMKKSWVLNNLGRMQQTVSKELRDGNAPAAAAALSRYRRDLAQAEGNYKLKLADKATLQEADAMESTISGVASSVGELKAEKSNRAAKDLQKKGLTGQRSN